MPSPSSGRGGNWTPVGTKAYPFASTFDGNGRTLTGLTIDNPAPSSVTLSTLDATPVVLFGFVEGTVENLNFNGVETSTAHID